MTVEKMRDEDRDEGLAQVPAWAFDPSVGAITRHFEFENFPEAFAFMVRVAMLAERMGHHPDWSNAWNKVDILLTTHDCGGLSIYDIYLARAIDTLVP